MKRTKDDIAWSDMIRKRAGWTCQRCGHRFGQATMGLHAAHIFSRAIKKTRHDPDNGLALCYGCHSWGHRNPLEFHAWAKGKLGTEKYEALMIRAKRVK